MQEYYEKIQYKGIDAYWMHKIVKYDCNLILLQQMNKLKKQNFSCRNN
jgi:hypothetical protein